jgi:hypothetical protein
MPIEERKTPASIKIGRRRLGRKPRYDCWTARSKTASLAAAPSLPGWLGSETP